MELPKYCTAFALISFVVIAEAAKSPKNTEVSTAFQKAGIVPDIIKVAPASKLKVTWETASAELGNYVCPLQTILPGRLEFKTVPGKYYTIVYIDADSPSRAAPVHRSYLLRLDVNAPASNLDGGFTFAPRIPPAPAPGSEKHRIIVLAYEQASLLDIYNAIPIQYGVSRIQFNVSRFERIFKLGAAVAGNFHYSEAPNYYKKQCCKSCTTCYN